MNWITRVCNGCYHSGVGSPAVGSIPCSRNFNLGSKLILFGQLEPEPVFLRCGQNRSGSQIIWQESESESEFKQLEPPVSVANAWISIHTELQQSYYPVDICHPVHVWSFILSVRLKPRVLWYTTSFNYTGWHLWVKSILQWWRRTKKRRRQQDYWNIKTFQHDHRNMP